MAAVMGRTELGVREFGTNVTIPSDPKARLMYYLDCMCVVLDLSDQSNLTRLRNYSSYYSLTELETDALVSLCFLLSPKELLGKVIFQDDSMCGTSSNAFFEISAVRHNLLLSDSIIIGGQQRHVSKVMAFKQAWMTKTGSNPCSTLHRGSQESLLGAPLHRHKDPPFNTNSRLDLTTAAPTVDAVLFCKR